VPVAVLARWAAQRRQYDSLVRHGEHEIVAVDAVDLGVVISKADSQPCPQRVQAKEYDSLTTALAPQK